MLLLLLAGLDWRWRPLKTALLPLGELSAKLRFLTKPQTRPLTFAQRILWVPALNSVNWGLTKFYFLQSFRQF